MTRTVTTIAPGPTPAGTDPKNRIVGSSSRNTFAGSASGSVPLMKRLQPGRAIWSDELGERWQRRVPVDRAAAVRTPPGTRSSTASASERNRSGRNAELPRP